jgi:hypothetical protein
MLKSKAWSLRGDHEFLVAYQLILYQTEFAVAPGAVTTMNILFAHFDCRSSP